MVDVPRLPRMTVESMLNLAAENTQMFFEIAIEAGHKNAETFLSILKSSVERKKAQSVRSYPAYSIERFRHEPDPGLNEYYSDLLEKAEGLALRFTSVFSTERKKLVEKMQNAYKLVYERELHVLVYARVESGEDLRSAYSAVKEEFRQRADNLREFGNMPLKIREIEAAAMMGSYAKTVVEKPNIFGPSEVFGELGIQSKRTDLFSFGGAGSGLCGGRIYWPRGNPDNSCDD